MLDGLGCFCNSPPYTAASLQAHPGVAAEILHMLQNLGRVHVAAFSDEALYAEMVGKAAFWQQAAYFGLDLTSLYEPAMAGYFQQVWALPVVR